MEKAKQYRVFGVNNRSVLYLTCYATMKVASIFFGTKPHYSTLPFSSSYFAKSSFV